MYAEEYTSFMEDILKKGYAEKVPPQQLRREDGKVWYIPHHGVYHKRKLKLRVVFDCTSLFQGTSLNKELLQGPDLTNTLIGLLLRFRQEQIAVMADIEAMFYQVHVDEKDRDFLRFLWWPEGDISKPLDVYRMKVHLFGAVSSSSIAHFALRQTADDNQRHYSDEVLKTIKTNFYVDDCLRSVSTADQAIKLVKDLTEACSQGGFTLTKWVSNNSEVLASIPEHHRAKAVKELDLDKEKLKEQITSCNPDSPKERSFSSTGERYEAKSYTKRLQKELTTGPQTLIAGDRAVNKTKHFFSKNTKVLCYTNDMVSDISEKILEITAEHPTVKSLVIHTGALDVVKQQSEVLKQDFNDLLNKVRCLNTEVFISGPLPTLWRGDERFSRLLMLNRWLKDTCAAQSVNFIDNFNIFSERRHLFEAHGFCLNKEYLHVFRKKSNTAAAAKERETAWEKIASRVNACNPAGEKRTWQQLKMKYKNIVQTERKKADSRKTGGGPAPPPLTVAEELALSHNTGRPVAEGIPGGSSSSECTPQDTNCDGAVCLVEEPPQATTDIVTDEEDEETVSAAFTEGDPGRPTELLPIFIIFPGHKPVRAIKEEFHRIALMEHTSPSRLPHIMKPIMLTHMILTLSRSCDAAHIISNVVAWVCSLAPPSDVLPLNFHFTSVLGLGIRHIRGFSPGKVLPVQSANRRRGLRTVT
ncbi:hypothetical protein N1851_014504 [Merluccius polli]|uniref:ribonuclease H n=1 Tax=Merluccius polli TaxID=89951 RepID=A0AA47MTA0_MERPO|nr:hypothetical protein N1851_014504 [Merluccius polli]